MTIRRARPRAPVRASLAAVKPPSRSEVFPTGRWAITPAAIAALAHLHADPAELIWRHRDGAWGDVDLDDAFAKTRP